MTAQTRKKSRGTPPSPNLFPPLSSSSACRLGAIHCNSFWQLKCSRSFGFSCRRTGVVIIIRGVNHRRLREVSWAAVCWDSPVSGFRCEETTTTCFPTEPALTVHVWTNKYEQAQANCAHTPLWHERKMMAWMMYHTVTHYKHSHTQTEQGKNCSDMMASVMQSVFCREGEWKAEKERRCWVTDGLSAQFILSLLIEEEWYTLYSDEIRLYSTLMCVSRNLQVILAEEVIHQ